MDTVEEVFDQIMKAKNWEKQELAEYIGVHPSTLSQKLGAHWNAHWRVFIRLLPLMLKLKIIGPAELNDNAGAKLSYHNRKKNLGRRRRRYIMSTLPRIPIVSQ
jgi:transcriptional regulator with XRE-family HTH domain